MATRRHFLSTLGKAASLPVTAAPLPFSAETLEMRKVKRALHRIRMANDGRGGPGCPWYETMVHEYTPLEKRLVARPARTWTDCVELAEAIWTFWDKEYRDGYFVGPETMRLSSGRRERLEVSSYRERRAVVALVEGILALGGGERFDPRMLELDDEVGAGT